MSLPKAFPLISWFIWLSLFAGPGNSETDVPKELSDMSPQQLWMQLKTRDRKAPISPLLSKYDARLIYKAYLANGKAVYGADNRVDVYEIKNKSYLGSIDSVCAIFKLRDVVNNNNGTSSLKTEPFNTCPDFGKKLCEQRFLNQPSGALGTGFLVAPDIIATAKHLVNEMTVAQTSFVFGFRMRNQNQALTVISNGEIYKGKKIIAKSSEGDWVLVKLDRPVVNHKLATLSPTEIDNNLSLYIIGHPCGLPLKFADSAKIVICSKERPFFKASVDAFHGNSGSPLFRSDTNEVVGILSSGNPDFAPAGDCCVPAIYPTTEGENCMKTLPLIKLLAKIQDRQ